MVSFVRCKIETAGASPAIESDGDASILNKGCQNTVLYPARATDGRINLTRDLGTTFLASAQC